MTEEDRKTSCGTGRGVAVVGIIGARIAFSIDLWLIVLEARVLHPTDEEDPPGEPDASTWRSPPRRAQVRVRRRSDHWTIRFVRPRAIE